MNYYEAIQVLALRAVIKQEASYNLRYIFRWYSRAFSTPLHVVEGLPLEDVLVAFFETRYEEMEEEERHREINILLETPEQKWERLLREGAEEAGTADFENFTLQQIQTKKKAPVKKAATYPEDLIMPPGLGPERVPPQTGETTLSSIKPLPPEVNMTFVDPDDFEKLLEGGNAIETDDKTR